jgi:hypothetical protein
MRASITPKDLPTNAMPMTLKSEMRQNKMSAEEITRCYTSVHQRVLDGDGDDRLSAVIGPGASLWVNRFTDFAHRLGMKKAFRVMEANYAGV